MDELLQQFGKTLQELQQFVSSVAPDVWELYLRQTMIDAWIGMIFGMFLLALSIYLFKLGFKNKEDEWVPWAYGGSVISFLIAFILLLVNGLRVLLNPQYFAMQDLLGIIK